jgi:hypothetical protein
MAIYDATDTNTSSVGKMLSNLIHGYNEAKRQKMRDEMYRLQMEQQNAKMAQENKENIEADQRRESMIKLFSQGQTMNQAKQQNQTNMALQDVQGMPGIPFAPTPEMKAQLPNNDADLAQQNQAFVEALSQAQGQLAAGQSKMNAFTPTTMSGLEGLGTIASGGNYKTPQEKTQAAKLAFDEKKLAEQTRLKETALTETKRYHEATIANSKRHDTDTGRIRVQTATLMAEAMAGRQVTVQAAGQNYDAAKTNFVQRVDITNEFRKQRNALKKEYFPDADPVAISLDKSIVDSEKKEQEARQEMLDAASLNSKVAAGTKGSPEQKADAANDEEGDDARDWNDQEAWWSSLNKVERAAFINQTTGQVDLEKARLAWKKKKTAK